MSSEQDITALKIYEPRRMLMLPLGILVGISIATTYAFGLVSNKLKEQFSMDQEDLTTVSTIGAVFSNFALPGGAIFDLFGPRVTLLLATCMSFTGMGLLSLSLSDTVPVSVLSLSVANALLSWGASWMDVSSLATNLLQFPLDKGAVIILQKTFQGLGSSVVAAYYSGFFPEQYAAYTGFVSFMILAHGLAAAAFMDLPPFCLTKWQQRRMYLQQGHEATVERWRQVYDAQAAPAHRLRLGFVLLGIMLAFLTGNSILVAYAEVSVGVRAAFASLVLILTLSFFLMAVPQRLWLVDRNRPEITGSGYTRAASTEQEESGVHTTASSSSCQPVLACGGCSPYLLRPASTSTAFITTSFKHNVTRGILIWLMFWTSLCNLGAGMVFIVNCAQIFTALNGGVDDHKMTSLIVSLMGVASAAGRILVGLAEMWLEKHGRSVSLVYPLPSATFCVGLSLALFVEREWMIVPFCLATFGHGFMCAVTVMTVRQTFGADLGKHYTMVAMGGLVAVIALNRFTFGVLFDREARQQGLYPRCVGHDCVNTAFLVLLVFNMSALASAVTVHLLRTRLANRAAANSAFVSSAAVAATGEMTQR